MFKNPAVYGDEAYIERRHELSRAPGAWECTAAARFLRAPWRERGAFAPPKPDYSGIDIHRAARDRRPRSAARAGVRSQTAAGNPRTHLHVFDNAGHCPHIDEADAFNEIALKFLLA